MRDYEETSARETIEQAAQAIFSILYHEGDMDLDELRDKVEGPPYIFDMAVGFLVEKKDIELLPVHSSFMVHRARPAPAVFPMRGD